MTECSHMALTGVAIDNPIASFFGVVAKWLFICSYCHLGPRSANFQRIGVSF